MEKVHCPCMYLVITVTNIDDLSSSQLLWKSAELKFVEIIQLSSTFRLVGKMLKNHHKGLWWEDSFFFYQIILKINPTVDVIYAEPIQELSCFDVVHFVLESD
jgi:hypothetical protein